VGLAAIALALCVAGIAIADVRGDHPVVAKAPIGPVDEREPLLAVFTDGVGRIEPEDVDVDIDGRAIRSGIDVSDGRIAVRAPRLDDGVHAIRVRVAAADIDEQWSIDVDATRPKLSVDGVPPADEVVPTRNVTLHIRTEPGSTVVLRAGDWTRKLDGDDGTVRAIARLPEQTGTLFVRSVDDAGNARSRSFVTHVDSRPPTTSVAMPRVVKDRTRSFRVATTDASRSFLRVRLDGIATAPEVTKVGRSSWRFVLPEDVPEGSLVVRVRASDVLGNVTERPLRVVVDSTEELGPRILQRGARGTDVHDLHRALVRKRVVDEGELGGDFKREVYGVKTVAAIKRWQRDKGLAADGIAGSDTIAPLALQIVIDRAANTLRLLRIGKQIGTWRVATGAAAFPTPTGNFTIVTMEKDPTWTPPNSDWAKDAKPIPPGPNNPLGTRWMGLDAPAVGIHGTNSPASIGYSVSHGCIRMTVPDVEDLFERVAVGTPVRIV
jgi:hypothetical protein